MIWLPLPERLYTEEKRSVVALDTRNWISLVILR